MTNSELRRLEAEADAYQAQADAERAAAPGVELEKMRASMSATIKTMRAVAFDMQRVISSDREPSKLIVQHWHRILCEAVDEARR